MSTHLLASDLHIRPFEDGDIEAFVVAVRESLTTLGPWMPWCRADYTATDAKYWFDTCAADLRAAEAFDLGIFSASSGWLHGGISINQLNMGHNFGNIGYWVRQSSQRHGIATRAVHMIAAFGFDELKLTRLEIIAAEANKPSRRVAEKVGAVFECIARNRLIVDDGPIAAAVYSLTPEQYGF